MPEPRRIEFLPLDDLQGHPENPKDHDLDLLDESFDRFDFTEPPLIDERTGLLAAGHGRIERLRQRRDAGAPAPEGVVVAGDGVWLVPVVRGWASKNDDEARAYLVASNKTTEAGGWRDDLLAPLLDDLRRSAERGLDGVGFSQEDVDALLASLDEPADSDTEPPVEVGSGLADRFLVPPFSVLDARQGYWQDRKRAWLSLGIRSEEGRADNLIGDAYRDLGERVGLTGTSVFDPVLCEVAYRWYSPEGGRVLDPFAGGSVRGITAAWLGRHYRGIDLSESQVAANREQAETILPMKSSGAGTAVWEVGDSASVLPEQRPKNTPPVDLLFSCPPYYDLEVYSDDPADLSAAPTYEAFLDGYREVIRRSCAHLDDDRFAVWVIGEIRDSAGRIRGFVPDTIKAFEAAGLSLHNDAILVTALGTLALRAGRTFGGARRLARAHQYVLVFVKGDPRKAVEACGPVDIEDIETMFGVPLVVPDA